MSTGPEGKRHKNRDDIVDWLLSESSRRMSHADMVEGLAEKLVACGVPLSVLSSSEQSYHPEVSVLNARWRADQPMSIQEFDYRVTEGADYKNSPLRASRKSSQPIRVRLTGDIDAISYPICRTLAKEGATDYYIFTQPEEYGSFASFATNASTGFRDQDIQLFKDIKDAVTIRLELHTVRRGIDSLLHLYLGRNAAVQVMSGSFRLGRSEQIEAVIWMCDLRGFTSLTEGASIDKVLQILNQYFACVVKPIQSRGGEVLKFIGDAVLAIFPVTKQGENDACERALEAATKSLELLAELNEERSLKKHAPLEFGVALHLGVVSYGNIGTPARLDFTVIGSAVNETARIEGLCSGLGESLLVSESFKSAYQGSLRSLGLHSLKGVAQPAEVFTLV